MMSESGFPFYFGKNLTVSRAKKDHLLPPESFFPVV